MKIATLRGIVLVGLALVMVGGYAASQFMVLTGRASQWAQAVDVPSISLLALVLLAASIALSFAPEDREIA